MTETNYPNGDTPQPYNNQQQPQYQNLSLLPPSDQPFQNHITLNLKCNQVRYNSSSNK